MGSAEASGPTPEEPLILLHAWQLLWVSLRHRWLIFLQYLRWKELTAQAREAAKDQRFFIWCSVRSWTGSAPDPRQRSSWVLGPGCLQSGAWRLLVPAPKTDAGTAMPSELRQGLQGAGLLGGGLCGGWRGWKAPEPSETLPLCCHPGCRPHLVSHLTY